MSLRHALLLLALEGCASRAPVAAPPVEDCTLETQLTPGIPGSPGHLVPSDINPNGASELAVRMRRMVADWTAAREALQAGHPVPGMPFYPEHRRIRCSWPTAAEDRNPAFDGMAQGYLAQVRAFDTAPSVQTFNAALSGCAACHEATCGGPLTVIEGLKLR
jgi:hypothetical protein